MSQGLGFSRFAFKAYGPGPRVQDLGLGFRV